MLGQMLAIEMLVIEIECVSSRCRQMMLADVVAWADVTGRCWQTMLAWQMLLADVAGRMVQRLK
jgi:hypothetical protein